MRNRRDNVNKLLNRVKTYSWCEEEYKQLTDKEIETRIEDLIQAQWFLKQLEMSYCNEIFRDNEQFVEESIICRDNYLQEQKKIIRKWYETLDK